MEHRYFSMKEFKAFVVEATGQVKLRWLGLSRDVLNLNPSILRSMNRGVDLWCRLFAREKSCLSSEFYSCRFLFWH